MCSSVGCNTRRSSRRIRPGERDDCLSKKRLPAHTASTCASSSSGDSFRASKARIQELQRKLCPITGVFRGISEDYRIFSTVLGKGHYGCVRECEHRVTGEVRAVKTVDKSKIRRMDHLRREVYLLHKIDHHGIMKMIDCYEDGNFVHIVTERYTGGELFDKISENTHPGGCYSEKYAAGIIKSLLKSVAYLHANDIAHRDIKPENILFESDEEDSPVKLIDFGLSRLHKSGDVLMNNPVGTAYYMAPEVQEGKYDKSCDIWSIGTIAYILLCGYPPFNGDTDPDIFEAIKKGGFGFPKAAWSSKSVQAKDFIKCLMTRDPAMRMDANEALKHPWIKSCCPDEDSIDKEKDYLISRIQMLRQTIKNFRK
mmetsp:Transcript_34427/g.58379  ORF Transcript_34427/g.58379 Transcript_34427/m.58379 type:complete len:369 (+) Transcript_34427:304-1410(+)|eukprot:CAMPEP_0183707578 /NCGR_PEP_ID=MMETSP0737-20130205/4122_1 /TAXON_ID=385413 /ORGANISM="Thalassiosira miniscula, Strain CCMP1093" /LENGTH=368 /DNA_ID=CAMNT_0025935287 /DNA_START=262 /DNA_END=1368 /DNA_ORIENTATION=-